MSKICKNCGVQYDAPSCPNCGSTELFQGLPPQAPPKKKKHGCLTAILITIGVLFLIGIIGAITSSGDDSDTSTVNSSGTSGDNKKDDNKPTEKPIEYTKYDVSELMDDLNSNAMKAEKKYNDQYVELTGKLYNIDSDGKYIDLGPSDADFTIIGVQCYIKSDDQVNKVMEMEKDQTVTLKGKITSVGEIIGFSLNIDEIE